MVRETAMVGEEGGCNAKDSITKMNLVLLLLVSTALEEVAYQHSELRAETKKLGVSLYFICW